MSNQGDRDNSSKPVISMVLEAPAAIEGVARVLEFGREKYARSNWKKGLPYTEIIDSMSRHLLKIMSGEDIDPESELPHCSHVLCNALFLSEMMLTRPDMEDRPVVTTVVSTQPGDN